MYGLIGYPLGSSFSASWFGERGVDYRNFELSSIDQLPLLLSSEPRLRGFNVTSPFKEAVLGYLDYLDPVAAAVGAVNCVVRTDALSQTPGEATCLIGYNTDAPALRDVLGAFVDGHRSGRCCVEPARDSAVPVSALILGTGGAAKAAAWALSEMGVGFKMVSRTSGDMTYDSLTPAIISSRHLIINATPVGSYALSDELPPLPYDALTSSHMLFDMIYNPSETLFLRTGRERGAHTCNGLSMLVRQAELSRDIWACASAGAFGACQHVAAIR